MFQLFILQTLMHYSDLLNDPKDSFQNTLATVNKRISEKRITISALKERNRENQSPSAAHY